MGCRLYGTFPPKCFLFGVSPFTFRGRIYSTPPSIRMDPSPPLFFLASFFWSVDTVWIYNSKHSNSAGLLLFFCSRPTRVFCPASENPTALTNLGISVKRPPHSSSFGFPPSGQGAAFFVYPNCFRDYTELLSRFISCVTTSGG